jgi:hypothetical protein
MIHRAKGLKPMSASLVQLHSKARRAIESGESKLREAAEYLAQAQKLGATQRQSAKAIGKSPAWVNALLKWRQGDYKEHCAFPRDRRVKRVQAAEQKRPMTAEQAQALTAKANAERAKAEAAKARAEAAARMFPPPTKTIPQGARDLLLKALLALASERAPERAAAALIVESQRARLNMKWDELLVPAASSEFADAA